MNKNTSDQNGANNNKQTLNLSDYLSLYEGIEISESYQTASIEEKHETIIIEEWVRPDWSEEPLLKRDFPEMQYVSYSKAPPP